MTSNTDPKSSGRPRQTDAVQELTESLVAVSRRCASLPDLDRSSPDEILGYDDQGSFK